MADELQTIEKGLQAAPAFQIGGGPRAATEAFQSMMVEDSDRCKWLMAAEVNAVLGSCPRSLASVKSGIKCWLQLSYGILRKPKAYPATVSELLAWSKVFWCTS